MQIVLSKALKLLTDMSEEQIKEELKKIAKENNYTLTDNVDKIIKAKLRFFGEENWRNCPCVRDGKHACLSETCIEQIESKGVCHCNLFKKGE